MNITILGCGAYGTALACMFNENNCNIKMWNKFCKKVIHFFINHNLLRGN